MTRTLRFLLAFVILGAFSACRRGPDLETVNIYTQYHGVTFVEKFKIWATGADEVVTPKSFYEPENYFYDGKGVKLFAFKGGRVAFQLVVNADFGNINNVEVKPGALAGPGGAAIPPEATRVYFEYFVKVQTKSDRWGRTGSMADPLPPLLEPFDVARAEAQPLFVTIDVPADAVPGTYTGGIAVAAKGAQGQTLAVELKVLPYAIDAAILPPAYLEPDYAAWATWGGHPGEPSRSKELAPYLALVADHHLRVLDGGYSQARLTSSPARAAKEWAKAAGETGIFYLSANADGSIPTNDALAAEYRALYDACKEKPRQPIIWCALGNGPALKGPAGSAAPLRDGPRSAAWWQALGRVASGWPGKPRLAAASSPYRGAPGALLTSLITWWVPRFGDVAVCPERYTNLRGSEYYLRVDGSGADLIDGRRAGARLISWYGYLWGARGLVALAPGAGAFRPAHPWIDDPLSGDAAAYGNGVGYWLYPGAPVGAKTPVTSIRLELLRQGLEDWVLFKYAEKKLGRTYMAERLMAALPYGVAGVNAIDNDDLGNNQIHELRQGLYAALAGEPRPGREANLAGRIVDSTEKPVYHARVSDGTFATYTDEAGSFRLHYRGAGRLEAIANGAGRNDEVGAGATKLYRGLRGLEAVYDFESGIDGAQWLAGEPSDAAAAGEERELVHEGRVALAVTFPCGRVGRVVNLYPRQKNFNEFHCFEFDLYNPNDFLVDVWLLVVDDDAAEVGDQYRRRITIRPKGWERVVCRIKDFKYSGEARFLPAPGGGAAVRPGYQPDMANVIGFGFEADGLAADGGNDNAATYRVIIDNVKVVKFE